MKRIDFINQFDDVLLSNKSTISLEVEIKNHSLFYEALAQKINQYNKNNLINENVLKKIFFEKYLDDEQSTPNNLVYQCRINLNVLYDELNLKSENICLYRIENTYQKGLYDSSFNQVKTTDFQPNPKEDSSLSYIFGNKEDQTYFKKWFFAFEKLTDLARWLQTKKNINEIKNENFYIQKYIIDKKYFLSGNAQCIFMLNKAEKQNIISFEEVAALINEKEKLYTRDEIVDWLDKYKIKNYSLIKNDIHGFVVDVNNSVDLSELGLDNIPIKFGKIFGSFWCQHNNLNHLNFAPEYVSLWFSCNNNQLKTLIGCPSFVGDGIECSNNYIDDVVEVPKNKNAIIHIYNNNGELKLNGVFKANELKKISEIHNLDKKLPLNLIIDEKKQKI